MKVYISRYRVTYIPDDGEPRVMLTPLHMCNNEPSLDGGPETQTDALLRSTWAHHHSKGNATARVQFDCFTPTVSLARAQADGLEMWRWLNEHPQGTILLETAFMGQMSAPLIRWKMHATLNTSKYTDLDEDSSPFGDEPGVLMAYDFTVTNPQDA